MGFLYGRFRKMVDTTLKKRKDSGRDSRKMEGDRKEPLAKKRPILASR